MAKSEIGVTPGQERGAPPANQGAWPLAVDLDGTLILGDVVAAAAWRMVAASPFGLFRLALWFLRGRAYAKARLAAEAPGAPARLAYNRPLLDWLRAQKATGRILVLATATDKRAAEAIATHVGLFDAVFASDGARNLKGPAKGAALARAFPEGFAYAGNEAADLGVWRYARAAIVVNASPSLARRAARLCTVERVFPRAV